MTKLYCLGVPEVRDDFGAVGKICAQTQRLIGYIATRPDRGVSRGALTQALWDGDCEKSRANLNTALWRCRKMLTATGQNPDTVLDCTPERVAVKDSAPLWLDFEELRAASALVTSNDVPILSGSDLRRLDKAADLYRGGFLEGCDADWCLIERESLTLAYQFILERLMTHHGAVGDWSSVVETSNRLLVLDPFLEHVHRTKMRALGEMGERAKVAEQYMRIRDLLRDELNVEPFPETEQAFREAMSAGAEKPSPTEAKGFFSRRRETEELRADQDRPELSTVISDLRAALIRLQQINSGR